jgi:hypothetical protein
MKPFFFLILCLVLSIAPAVLATDAITPAEASKHAGEEVFVEGVVASVHATPKGVAFINLDNRYLFMAYYVKYLYDTREKGSTRALGSR